MECSICLDVASSPLTTCCSHTFCLTCILLWKATHNTCPMCRQTLRVSWTTFEDFPDPGPLWVERPPPVTVEWPVTLRDMYRRMRMRNRDRVYMYSRTNPPGLFDHWKEAFVTLPASDPRKIAFWLANLGLARTSIESVRDEPPSWLGFCATCSAYVTCAEEALNRHKRDCQAIN